jgi:hypothetical protein
MQFAFLRFFALFGLLTSLLAVAQSHDEQSPPRGGGDFSTILHPTEKQKVPEGVIVVKGAWSSASDSATPLPESGGVTSNLLSSSYFGINYTLPPHWAEKHKGPPPSDTGFYRLAFITPTPAYKGPRRGSVAVFAQDMFFTTLPASNALEFVNYKKDTLQADYKIELEPSATSIAGRVFSFYAYWSPAAELHWYVLATEIRCHTVEFVLTSSDTKLLESLVLDLNKMKLPAEASPTGGQGGGDVPVCIKDYANGDHVVERVEPVFSERRFNAVPVRIIIDKQGKIKHIHFISAFPEQAKAIGDALAQWRFSPYLLKGQPVEVETGIMFGRAPLSLDPKARTASSTQE